VAIAEITEEEKKLLQEWDAELLTKWDREVQEKRLQDISVDHYLHQFMRAKEIPLDQQTDPEYEPARESIRQQIREALKLDAELEVERLTTPPEPRPKHPEMRAVRPGETFRPLKRRTQLRILENFRAKWAPGTLTPLYVRKAEGPPLTLGQRLFADVFELPIQVMTRLIGSEEDRQMLKEGKGAAALLATDLERIAPKTEKWARDIAEFSGANEGSPLWEAIYHTAYQLPETVVGVGIPGGLNRDQYVQMHQPNTVIGKLTSGGLDAAEYFAGMALWGKISGLGQSPNAGALSQLAQRAVLASAISTAQAPEADFGDAVINFGAYMTILGASQPIAKGLEKVAGRVPFRQALGKIGGESRLRKAFADTLEVGGKGAHYLLVDRADDWVESVFETAFYATRVRPEGTSPLTAFFSGLPSALFYNYFQESVGSIGPLVQTGVGKRRLRQELQRRLSDQVEAVGRDLTDEERTGIRGIQDALSSNDKFKDAIENGFDETVGEANLDAATKLMVEGELELVAKDAVQGEEAEQLTDEELERVFETEEVGLRGRYATTRERDVETTRRHQASVEDVATRAKAEGSARMALAVERLTEEDEAWLNEQGLAVRKDGLGQSEVYVPEGTTPPPAETMTEAEIEAAIARDLANIDAEEDIDNLPEPEARLTELAKQFEEEAPAEKPPRAQRLRDIERQRRADMRAEEDPAGPPTRSQLVELHELTRTGGFIDEQGEVPEFQDAIERLVGQGKRRIADLEAWEAQHLIDHLRDSRPIAEWLHAKMTGGPEAGRVPELEAAKVEKPAAPPPQAEVPVPPDIADMSPTALAGQVTKRKKRGEASQAEEAWALQIRQANKIPERRTPVTDYMRGEGIQIRYMKEQEGVGIAEELEGKGPNVRRFFKQVKTRAGIKGQGVDEALDRLIRAGIVAQEMTERELVRRLAQEAETRRDWRELLSEWVAEEDELRARGETESTTYEKMEGQVRAAEESIQDAARQLRQVHARGRQRWALQVDEAAREADAAADEIQQMESGFSSLWTRARMRPDDIPDSVKVPDPEVEASIVGNKGLKKRSWMEDTIEGTTDLFRKVARPRRYLPQDAFHAQANEGFRLLSDSPASSMDKAVRALAAITDALGPQKFHVFERKILTDDAVASVQRDEPRPHRFKSTEQLMAYQQQLDSLIERLPEVQRALEINRNVMEALKNDLLEWNILTPAQAENWETYFRHQVHQYMDASGKVPRGRSMRHRRPDFTKERVRGYEERLPEHDFNTDYLEAMGEYFTESLHNINKAQIFEQFIVQPYDVYKDAKQEAKRRNTTAINAYFDQLAESMGLTHKDGTPVTGRQLLRKTLNWKQAAAISKLAKIAASPRGLPGMNEGWDDVIEMLTEGHEQYIIDRANAKEMDLPMSAVNLEVFEGQEGEMARFWAYTTWLLEQTGDEYREGARAAALYWKGVTEKQKFIKEKLGRAFATWDKLIPEGYGAYWLKPKNIFYPAYTVQEKLVRKLQEGVIEEANITEEELTKVMAVGGPRRPYILPNTIIKQLEVANAPKTPNKWRNMEQSMLRAWKVWTLLYPKRFVSYNVRNLTGDMDPVIAAAPGVLLPKYQGRAWREMWNFFHGKKLAVPQDVQDARDLAVITSTLTGQEVPEFKDLQQFKRFYGAYRGGLTDYNIRKHYFNFVSRETQFREAALRYASYLYYLDKINQGKPFHYGASRKAVVDALPTNKHKAAHLARNLIGDYGNLSEMGMWLRSNLIPFYSWMEINTRRWPRLLINSFTHSPGQGRASGAASTAARLARTAFALLRVPAQYAAFWWWNNHMYPEEEKQLTGYDRANPHLVLGRDTDGRVLIFRNVGALGDFAEWFGVNDFITLYPELRAGRVDIDDVLKTMGQAPVNKVMQSLRPEIDALLFGMILGVSTFPHALRPRRVEKGDVIPQAMGLQDEVNWTRRKLFGHGKSIRPGYEKRFFMGVVDPRAAALSEIHELRRRYLEQKGEATGTGWGISITRDMRRAAENDDFEAFRLARIQFMDKGYNKKRFKQSINSLDPVGPRLNKRREREFEHGYLSGDQRIRLHVARQYARELEGRLWEWWYKARKLDKR
jgi:hypothetical protein